MGDTPATEPLVLGTRAAAERFIAIANLIPDRPAVGDLEDEVTYGELLERSARVAAVAASIERRGPVLLPVDDAIGFATGMVASLLLGRPSVVISPTLASDALRVTIERTGAALLIGTRTPEREQSGLPVIGVDVTVDAAVDATVDVTVEQPLEWSDVVTLTATSGSTGDPKLIEQTSATPTGLDLGTPAPDRPFEHTGANLSASGAFRGRMAAALFAGNSFTAFPLDRLPPAQLVLALARSGPTDLSITPTLLRRLTTADRGRTSLRSVRRIRSVGEPLRWSDVALARQLCGPHVTLRNLYGSTEAGIVTVHEVTAEQPVQDGDLPVGRAVAGRRVWIARPDGTPAPHDEVGRIVVEGRFTTRGVPFEALDDGTERFRSSDLGRIDADGLLWFMGRDDRMVKVAGMRVEPGAVEDAIRAFPGVQDAAVVPVALAPDEWRLVAHVAVTDDSTPFDVASLREHVRERITSIAVPVRFLIRTAPLPMLASGKVDLRALSTGDGRPGADDEG